MLSGALGTVHLGTAVAGGGDTLAAGASCLTDACDKARAAAKSWAGLGVQPSPAAARASNNCLHSQRLPPPQVAIKLVNFSPEPTRVALSLAGLAPRNRLNSTALLEGLSSGDPLDENSFDAPSRVGGWSWQSRRQGVLSERREMDAARRGCLSGSNLSSAPLP